jgi:hypothetical protein
MRRNNKRVGNGVYDSLLGLWWYERSNVLIYIGLRKAPLEGVLYCQVYAMDILRLWDTGAGIDEVNVYEGINGFLRGRLVVAGR